MSSGLGNRKPPGVPVVASVCSVTPPTKKLPCAFRTSGPVRLSAPSAGAIAARQLQGPLRKNWDLVLHQQIDERPSCEPPVNQARKVMNRSATSEPDRLCGRLAHVHSTNVYTTAVGASLPRTRGFCGKAST